MNRLIRQIQQFRAGINVQLDALEKAVTNKKKSLSAYGFIDVGENPAVTAMCPTYGRFTQLRNAVACFLLQDYTPRRLLIVNDSPFAINLSWSGAKEIDGDGWSIKLRNVGDRYTSLGEKRTAMAQMAETPLIAHWDDDDLYLPWHLSQMVAAQNRSKAAVIAQWPSYELIIQNGATRIVPMSHKPHDGGWLFSREWLMEVGGYRNVSWGETVPLQKRSSRDGLFYPLNPQLEGRGISYLHVYGDDGHIHMNDCKGDREAWRSDNNIYGDEQLMPGIDIEGFRAESWAGNRIESLLRDISESAPGGCNTFRIKFQRPHVFCVGFQKTGTSSLTLALGMMGWDVTGSNWMTERGLTDEVVKERASKRLETWNAAADNPWPVLWRWLAEEYPDARFILTVRDLESWSESVERHFGDVWTPGHAYIYGEGRYVGNERLWRRRFQQHNDEVQKWFERHRPDDLLVMDICGGEADWGALCEFLGCEQPAVPFPHCQEGTTVMDHLRHGSKLAELPENRDSEAVKRYRQVSACWL